MPINISSLNLPTFKNVDSIDSLIESGITPLLNIIVGFSIVVAVALIIVSGYNMITSMGEPEKIQKGQKGLVAAIIGLVVVIVARLIVLFILEVIAGKSA